MELVNFYIVYLMVSMVGILIKAGWNEFYHRFIYRHTKKWLKECRKCNDYRARLGLGPKYDEKGRIIPGCQGVHLHQFDK